jgi:hypothetical protein
MPKLTGLLFNEDETDFFYVHAITADMDGGAIVDRYFDVLADAGVTVLMINTNARKTDYRSDVWENYWYDYDPRGPDDQPYFKGMPPGDVPGWRRMVHSMMVLDQQGVDYPARVIAGCRLRGVSPWITLRMNDVHYNDNLDNPFHGKFWRDPKYFRGGQGYFARALDYAHPEVRDMYRALIVETLDRYDIDGLELDFMREPYCFHPGAEAEGGKILHDWLRGIRRLVYDASVRRGHPIHMGVRVPSHVDVAKAWGLDAVTWASEGLVDLVVATPRWATLEYDMPLGDWARALAGTDVTLAGGLEILHRPMTSGPAVAVSKEQAAGAAAQVLASGADVVYLFNYFSPISASPDWTPEGYRRTLRAMSSLEALNGLVRRHAITWRDITGPAEEYQPPLPAEGKALEFLLPTGPKPPTGARALLELRVAQAAEAQAPAVAVDGTPCAFQGAKPNGDGASLATYDVPISALPGNHRHAIKVTAPGDAPVKVLGLEICITPAP